MTFEDRDTYGMYKRYDKSGPGPELMGAGTLMGEDVVNRSDEDLGDIKEIMLDMRSGQVAYAVLSFGGMLGLGTKLFAVPWQALQLDTVNKRFVLDISKDRLESAPGFDPDAWPDMTDVTWTNQIHTFYGTEASRSGSMQAGSMPMGGMSAGTGMGAGAGSMGAGHAGTAGSSGSGMTGGSGAPRSGAGGSGAGSEGGDGL
jgi:sporulation protein YlmC with PRC-barrel domain